MKNNHFDIRPMLVIVAITTLFSSFTCFLKAQQTITFNKNSFPFYNLVSNNNTHKIYCFNTTEAHNGGIYVFDKTDESIINLNDDQFQDNNIEKAVGSCVYNPFTNQFLVTENADFGNSPAVVKVLNANDNSFVSEIQLTHNGTNAQYAKQMYVSPAEKLYVAANTVFEQNTNPVIFIFDATTYQLLKTVTITIPPPNDPASYYSIHFCYVKDKNAVYATVMAQENTFSPYNTMYNTMFDFAVNTNENQGKLVNLDDDNFNAINIDFPGKVICPASQSLTEDSQFAGKLYIISKTLTTCGYNSGSMPSESGFKLNDIIYSPLYDEMYGFADVSNSETCSEDRKAVLYKITSNNGILVFTEIGSYAGQISSIFINPYNGLLYVHTKFDNHKLGSQPSMLLEYNPEAPVGSNFLGSIDLSNSSYPQNRSYYPELDNNPDYHYYNYNLTTPYIDPYQNKIYLPNGGHSNVSVVDYTADEALMLKPYDENTGESFTWLSFPRLHSTSPSVQSVLGGDNVVPNSDPYKYQTGSQLENLPLGQGNSITNEYDGTNWANSGPLTHIDPTLGYKLILKYNSDPNQNIKLFLHGTVIDPSTAIAELYTDKENWIGYWLYREQNPFDAIADDVLDELTEIKAQEWFCYKDWYMGQQNPQWICGVGKGVNTPSLKYGDMVILKSNNNISNFQWQNGVQAEFTETRPEPESFQYNEKEDYTAYLIEIDTSNRPAEIGAFIGNTCIGATRVMEDDTLVLVRGYDKDTTGTVYFVQYFNSQKSSMPAITDYYVKNSFNTGWQKRVINAEERNNHYLISFREQKTVQPDKSGINPILNLHPNPAKDVLVVKYVSETAGNITVALYDVTGKTVLTTTIEQPSGIHSLKLSTMSLKNGIYLLRLSSANKTGVRQIVINK